MKNTIKMTLLALAGVALVSTQQVRAFSYADGDLLLGFRAAGGTGSTTTLVINLGANSSYNSPTATPFSLTSSIGNLAADLTTYYGSGWATRTDLYWGVAGGTTSNQLLLSRPQSTYDAITSPWARANSTLQSNVKNTIAGTGSAYAAAATAGSNSLVAVEATTDVNNWAIKVTPNSTTNAFTANSFTSGKGIEASFAAGADTTAVDLYFLAPGSGNGTYRGSFQISSSGDVYFGLVPEPSTYASLLVGVLFLFAVVRRQRLSA
jgi:hypothetical protein